MYIHYLHLSFKSQLLYPRGIPFIMFPTRRSGLIAAAQDLISPKQNYFVGVN